MTMELTSSLCICAVALLFQNASGFCIHPSYDCVAPWARTFLAWRSANTKVAGSHLSPLWRNIPKFYPTCDDVPLPGAFPAPASGGLAVTSVSNGPIGISVLSENKIQGPLAVAGELPFLGSVALEGALPTVGSGSVSYNTGGPSALLAAKSRLLNYNRDLLDIAKSSPHLCL